MSNNQTNYDASFCNTIPLHNTNAIQPHAVILVLDVIEFRVIQMSSNVCEWLGITLKDVLNQPFERVAEAACVDTIKDKYRKSLFKNMVPEYLTFISSEGPRTYLARINEKEHYLLIEVEFINKYLRQNHL